MTDPLENIITQLIQEVGEDPSREGLLRTPQRVAKAWRSLTEGYHTGYQYSGQ